MPAMGINVMNYGGRTELSDFQVADVIIFNSYLSESDIVKVENYLMDLYGITADSV